MVDRRRGRLWLAALCCFGRHRPDEAPQPNLCCFGSGLAIAALLSMPPPPERVPALLSLSSAFVSSGGGLLACDHRGSLRRPLFPLAIWARPALRHSSFGCPAPLPLRPRVLDPGDRRLQLYLSVTERDRLERSRRPRHLPRSSAIAATPSRWGREPLGRPLHVLLAAAAASGQARAHHWLVIGLVQPVENTGCFAFSSSRVASRSLRPHARAPRRLVRGGFSGGGVVGVAVAVGSGPSRREA